MALTREKSPPFITAPVEDTSRPAEESAVTWNNLGVDLGLQGRFEEALEAFGRALLIKEGSPQALNNKGVALDCLGQYGDAYAAFDKVFDSRGVLQGGAARLYHFWATLALAQGPDAMLAKRHPGLRTSQPQVHRRPGESGTGRDGRGSGGGTDAVRGGAQEKEGAKGLRGSGGLLRLMKIKDSFEAWRALGKEVSNQWPKGHSVVKAIREIRR